MAQLLMPGISSCTYRVGNTIIKVPRLDDEDTALLRENLEACHIEAECYQLLGSHPRVARCIYISPLQDFLVLEHYNNGDLRAYSRNANSKQRFRWARQMVEGVAYVHSRGIRHSDLRLSQWLVDEEQGARLSDFNASGHDGDGGLGMERRKAVGLESAPHFLPRDAVEDNTVRSDLFALGSSFYELEVGEKPYEDVCEERVTALFEKEEWPDVSGLELGGIMLKCWLQRYQSADEILVDLQEISLVASSSDIEDESAVA